MTSAIDQNLIMDNTLDEKQFHRIKHLLKNANGVSYNEFKKRLKPNYNRVAIDITVGWIMITGCLAIGVLLNEITTLWMQIIGVFCNALLLGFIINYLTNFFHEAAHYNITSSKTKNDLLANCFLGIFQAQDIKHYRQIHWQHHLHLGTPRDTEHSYFNALTIRFVIESLFGIRAFKVFLFRNNMTSILHKKVNEHVNRNGKTAMLLLGIAFHLIMLSVFAVTHQYPMIFSWLLGFGMFFPFFGSLRQLLEHRSDHAQKQIVYQHHPHGRTNRLFGNDVIAKTFGSAGFNKHLLHHLEPQISYTNLPQLEAYLNQTIIAPQLNKQRSSYLNTFQLLLGK